MPCPQGIILTERSLDSGINLKYNDAKHAEVYGEKVSKLTHLTKDRLLCPYSAQNIIGSRKQIV